MDKIMSGPYETSESLHCREFRLSGGRSGHYFDGLVSKTLTWVQLGSNYCRIPCI
jgi:hypothetical protein